MGTRRFLQSLIREAARKIESIEAGNPQLEAEYLMAEALRTDRRGFLGLGEKDPIDPAVLDRFEALLTRRLSREPLQYVLGTVPFCEIELEVGSGVLIPRSETEILVERITRWARSSFSIPSASERPWMIDVGTGSGAILFALLTRLPDWSGLGIDLSAEALVFARRNRTRLELDDRAFLSKGNLLDAARRGNATPRGGKVWMVASNPPYIPSAEIGELAPEIRDHEPRIALDGGVDGLEYARRICTGAARILEPGGLLAFELTYDQPEVLADLLAREGDFEPVELFRDLSDRSRGLLAVRR